ncbi:hypothetical protein [Clostridium estertheticum]|nr:hypothetical protein [Clostridium estertheticum]MCB2343868.1 hypothetical protein [Clostridium estertheticum]
MLAVFLCKVYILRSSKHDICGISAEGTERGYNEENHKIISVVNKFKQRG